MSALSKSAERYFHNYVRGGNKDNRKKQVTRISHFLDWAEETHKVGSFTWPGQTSCRRILESKQEFVRIDTV